LEDFGLAIMKDELAARPIAKVALECEGEKWVKEKNVFYLLKTSDPIILTNLRNSYTEDYWKEFSLEIENGAEVTIIPPSCLFKMYKEKVL
jgi:hypothetical protein